MPIFGTCFDLEANGLKPTKIHCLVSESLTTNVPELIKFSFEDENAIWVGHNIIRFDIPVIERLVGAKIPKTTLLVDTLALSWYLYPKRKNHGLADWGEELGVSKPEVEDWENGTQEEYLHRCTEDVKITKLLWKKMYGYLLKIYGSDEKIKRFLRYLQFKMECARLQEESRWLLDRKLCEETIEKLDIIKDQKVDELRAAMPSVPIVSTRKKPKQYLKADGELSELGRKWSQLLTSRGLPQDYDGDVSVITGYDPPNPNSHDQIKEWLFSLGWIPQTFKTSKKGVEVPQINKQKQDGGGVCQSIKSLEETHPELAALDGYFVLGHRLGILRGFLRDVDSDGYLTACVAGLTNTLRFKHAEIVNLPKIDVPYGQEVRGCLIAPDGFELLGSDMSSLEDRTKQHYMWPYDPEFVLEMSKPGFDPHLDLALSAGKLTESQCNDYKSNVYDPIIKTIRGIFKNGNYSCTYGAGPPKIAKTTGLPLSEAQEVHKAYWTRNWSLKAIAKACKTKTIDGIKWLYNPVSTFWYYLREEKDRFSTLNQGTGVYCFDIFVACVLKRRRQLTAQFHDEIVLLIKKGYREQAKKMLNEAIEEVNDRLNLNRRLDIGIEFGDNYAAIH